MSWYMRCLQFRIFFSYLIVAQQSLTPEVPVWWMWVAGAIVILAALILAVIVWIMAGRAVAATDHRSKRREPGLPSVTIYRCDVILACTAYEQQIHPLAARFP